jgi:hypothetical protein
VYHDASECRKNLPDIMHKESDNIWDYGYNGQEGFLTTNSEDYNLKKVDPRVKPARPFYSAGEDHLKNQVRFLEYQDLEMIFKRRVMVPRNDGDKEDQYVSCFVFRAYLQYVAELYFCAFHFDEDGWYRHNEMILMQTVSKLDLNHQRQECQRGDRHQGYVSS